MVSYNLWNSLERGYERITTTIPSEFIICTNSRCCNFVDTTKTLDLKLTGERFTWV